MSGTRRRFKLQQKIAHHLDGTKVLLPKEVAQLIARFGMADTATDKATATDNATTAASAASAASDTRQPWLALVVAARAPLGRAALVSLLSALAAAVAIVSGMQILRIPAGGVDIARIALFIGLFFGMNLLAVWGSFVGNRLRATVGLTVETLLAHRLVAKFWHIRQRNLQHMPAGSLKVLLSSDARNVGSFMDSAVRNLLPALTAALVAIPLLAAFAGVAGLAGFATMLLLIPISSGLSKFSARYQRRIQTTLDQLTALTGEWVSNVRLIRYLDWEQPILRDLAAIMRRLTLLSMRQSLLAFLVFGLSISWWMISIAMVALAAKWLDIAIDLAQFFAAIWLITLLHGYLMHIPTSLRLYANAAASMRRLQNFFQQDEQASLFLPADPALPPFPAPFPWSASQVRRVHFEQVSYGTGGSHILRELTFSLDLRQKTALIGEIGSGKSTLLSLLLGDEAPTGGRILIEFDDGSRHDLWHEAVHRVFRQNLALVPQQAFISNDSLLTNISLDQTAEPADVFQAAYAAELEADLQHFADGLQQEIGEGGINLSGGQRQRVNLARAFYSGRAYLVLDDPMSAVDQQVEQRLMAQLMQSRGFFLVSHRLGELLQVDRVLVLKNGQLLEQGEPRQLHADANSHFNRIYHAYGPGSCDSNSDSTSGGNSAGTGVAA